MSHSRPLTHRVKQQPKGRSSSSVHDVDTLEHQSVSGICSFGFHSEQLPKWQPLVLAKWTRNSPLVLQWHMCTRRKDDKVLFGFLAHNGTFLAYTEHSMNTRAIPSLASFIDAHSVVLSRASSKAPCCLLVCIEIFMVNLWWFHNPGQLHPLNVL